MKGFRVESHPGPHNISENLNSSFSPSFAFHIPVLILLFHLKSLLWRGANSIQIYIWDFCICKEFNLAVQFAARDSLMIPSWQLIICKRKFKINKCLVPMHSSNTYTVCTKAFWIVQVVKKVTKKVTINKVPFFCLINTSLWKLQPLIFLSKHTGAT